ncbi:MAG: GNAT family N-acetyltransferase [Marinobacter adhaerens]
MKKVYRELCEHQPSIPLFSQAWWLDSVAGDNWDVVLVEKGGEVQAAMPFVVRRKLGFTLLTQPSLTQCLGPWIRPTPGKYAKRLSREKDLMQALIEQLPVYTHFQQNWQHAVTNWLPFYWKGFEQTTRYTYRIDCLDDEETIWAGLQSNIKGDIRKARNREGVVIRDDLAVSDFFSLNEMVFTRQGKKLPYTRAFVENLDTAATQRGARKIFVAEDGEGRRHAGVYLVWDRESAYYLMGGGDPHLRNSGATSLCMWEAIKFASTVTKSFDFEGSMNEPVERFFRAFGAKQTPYHAVSHTPSQLFKLIRFVRSLT